MLHRVRDFRSDVQNARLQRRKEILIEIPAGMPDSAECFTVSPRRSLSRFRSSISAKRLSAKGWYKRFSKRIVL